MRVFKFTFGRPLATYIRSRRLATSAMKLMTREHMAIVVGLGVASNILSGGILPLDVFETQWQQLFALLPLQYVIYFPLNILKGICAASDILQGILIQGF